MDPPYLWDLHTLFCCNKILQGYYYYAEIRRSWCTLHSSWTCHALPMQFKNQTKIIRKNLPLWIRSRTAPEMSLQVQQALKFKAWCAMWLDSVSNPQLTNEFSHVCVGAPVLSNAIGYVLPPWIKTQLIGRFWLTQSNRLAEPLVEFLPKPANPLLKASLSFCEHEHSTSIWTIRTSW